MPEQRSLFAVSEEPEPPQPPTADAAARMEAVDITRSVLVQAPAGAGKTELLTERFLRLLAKVDEPEEILAITFTVAATAEMRGRVLTELQKAAEGRGSPHAAAALAHANARGWRLLEQPHRLDVQTIDSLCLRLAHAQPILARLGGRLQPATDAKELYARAARRTLGQLGADAALDHALRRLLLRRDNNLAEAERLLAGMLEQRSAWLGVLPLAPGTEVAWSEVRATLEAPFARERARILGALAAAFARIPVQAEDLLALARYAGGNLAADNPSGVLLRDLRQLPNPQSDGVETWVALGELLLTQKSEWRKSWRDTNGFPAKSAGPDAAEWKERMKDWCGSLAASEHGASLCSLFCAARTLPPARYSDDQWETLQAIFRVLRRAAAELRIVFAEANQVDFPEIASAAEDVLRDELTLRGMLESERKRHLLVDEFQDTSRAQYRLIAELLREWSEGDGRTVFLVGDPLQSIYGFRQAEVALFHQTREHGLPCGDGRRHPCAPVKLTQNFRSHRELVQSLNTRLARVFDGAGEDTFVPAEAHPLPLPAPSFVVHTQFDHGEEAAEDPAPRREAEKIVEVLLEERPRLAAAQAANASSYRIAVLVRSKRHLAAILPALRAASIPFRAIELEPLAEQPEIVDMLALARALLQPADRLAWLSVLRAPWCGLLLGDLHTIAGGDDRELQRLSLPELFEQRIPLLTPDGRERAERTWNVLRTALATRYAAGSGTSLAAWVERTWMALGGNATLDATARENVEAFLRLLDQVAPDGVEMLGSAFAPRLRSLFAAPDPAVSDRFGVQLMTIHKAKGLGFDVVLVPGLHAKTRGRSTELLAMMQRTGRGPDLEDELLLAPLGESDGEKDAAYAWVSAQNCAREREEARRLFYVACTRARSRLHLFTTVRVKNGELAKPDPTSLLAAAWPGLQADIEEALARLPAQAPSQLHRLAASAAPQPLRDDYVLERLPSGWRPASLLRDVQWRAGRTPGTAQLFERTQSGSLARRARGTAMHLLLEQLTRGAGAARQDMLARVAAQSLRGSGVPRAAASAEAAQLAASALDAAASESGAWLLAAHPEAGAETAWQHLDAGGVLRNVRVDRSFLAGPAPGSYGETHRWVVDYKTGAEPGDFADEDALDAWLATQKSMYRQQLEIYGAILREARGDARPLRFAVFFPELRRLLYWDETASSEH